MPAMSLVQIKII